MDGYGKNECGFPDLRISVFLNQKACKISDENGNQHNR